MSYQATPAIAATWNKLVEFLQVAHAGYHQCISNLTRQLKIDPDASFVINVINPPGFRFRYLLQNMDDGSTADEAGNFQMYVGPTIDDITWHKQSPILPGGWFQTHPVGAPGLTLYTYIQKDTFRSGIWQYTWP